MPLLHRFLVAGFVILAIFFVLTLSVVGFAAAFIGMFALLVLRAFREPRLPRKKQAGKPDFSSNAVIIDAEFEEVDRIER